MSIQILQSIWYEICDYCIYCIYKHWECNLDFMYQSLDKQGEGDEMKYLLEYLIAKTPSIL